MSRVSSLDFRGSWFHSGGCPVVWLTFVFNWVPDIGRFSGLFYRRCFLFTCLGEFYFFVGCLAFIMITSPFVESLFFTESMGDVFGFLSSRKRKAFWGGLRSFCIRLHDGEGIVVLGVFFGPSFWEEILVAIRVSVWVLYRILGGIWVTCLVSGRFSCCV